MTVPAAACRTTSAVSRAASKPIQRDRWGSGRTVRVPGPQHRVPAPPVRARSCWRPGAAAPALFERAGSWRASRRPAGPQASLTASSGGSPDHQRPRADRMCRAACLPGPRPPPRHRHTSAGSPSLERLCQVLGPWVCREGKRSLPVAAAPRRVVAAGERPTEWAAVPAVACAARAANKRPGPSAGARCATRARSPWRRESLARRCPAAAR
jgi:hypothetical protein